MTPMRRNLLVPIEEAEHIYARLDGRHYHLSRECMMLSGDFERLGYEEIKVGDVKRRQLRPCICSYKDFILKGAE